MSIALWTPSREYVEASELHRFKEFAERKSGRLFDNYEALYRWSVEELESFWAYCLEYFDIDYSGTYGKVLDWDAQSGDFIAARWFEGITLNYAEHIFKQASSARPALKFGSETEGYREVSWNELAEMVSALQQFLVEKGIGKGHNIKDLSKAMKKEKEGTEGKTPGKEKGASGLQTLQDKIKAIIDDGTPYNEEKAQKVGDVMRQELEKNEKFVDLMRRLELVKKYKEID